MYIVNLLVKIINLNSFFPNINN